MLKRILFILGIALLIFACSSSKNAGQGKDGKNTTEDSTEYDVEMFDAKFYSWYERYQTPANYRQQSYYESWNKQYVSMWNNKANSSSGKFPFDPVVGYNATEDYGFELNHKLFHYFMYVENVLKVKIMPGGPNFILL